MGIGFALTTSTTARRASSWVYDVIAAFGAYIALRRIQRFDVPEKPYGERNPLENRIYEMGIVYRVVDRLVPGNYTVKRAKFESLIKGSVSGINIQILYTRRIIMGLLAFLMGLVLFIGLNLNNAYRILHVPEIPKGYLGGRLSDADYEKMKEITIGQGDPDNGRQKT